MATKKPADLSTMLKEAASPTPPPPPKGSVAATPSRVGKRHIGGHFQPEWARVLNGIAYDEERTVQDLLHEALEMLFKSRGKKTPAR